MKSFAAGFAAAAAAFGVAYAMDRFSSRKIKNKHVLQTRRERFNSVTRTLDLALGESSSPETRVMVAIAVGEDLILEHIEPRLLNYLGYSHLDRTLLSVYDFLPPGMVKHHKQWVRNSIRARQLPDRLSHPLRSVEIRHASGFYVQMDLNIEWVSESAEPVFNLVFIPISPPSSPVPNPKASQQV
jgi:hypothetical protein